MLSKDYHMFYIFSWLEILKLQIHFNFKFWRIWTSGISLRMFLVICSTHTTVMTFFNFIQMDIIQVKFIWQLYRLSFLLEFQNEENINCSKPSRIWFKKQWSWVNVFKTKIVLVDLLHILSLFFFLNRIRS
jgi:hypothetical protein